MGDERSPLADLDVRRRRKKADYEDLLRRYNEECRRGANDERCQYLAGEVVLAYESYADATIRFRNYQKCAAAAVTMMFLGVGYFAVPTFDDGKRRGQMSRQIYRRHHPCGTRD